ISDSISRSTTGLTDVAGSEIYRFDLALSSPIALNSNDTYYLSVVNEFDQNDASAIWYWLLSNNAGSNYFRLSDAEAWLSDTTGNMAFSVSTTVPLPSALGLWLVGGALIGFLGKRKA
ncbi:PEP-CTERM sorting domain-containing protein, partial [Methylomonas rivi]